MNAHLLTLNKSINLLIIANHVIEAFVIFTQNGLSISPNPDIKITNQSVQRKTNYFAKTIVVANFFLFLLRGIIFDTTQNHNFLFLIIGIWFRMKVYVLFFYTMLSLKVNRKIQVEHCLFSFYCKYKNKF
jgi:hypothetical protein